MTAINSAGGPSTTLDPTIVGRIAPDPDMSLTVAAAALAGTSARFLPRHIRSYTKQSRAMGVSVQDTVKNLVDLAREANPDDPELARRSSEIAQCAIDAYFEAPEAPVSSLLGDSTAWRQPWLRR
jgi:hypothetical protein